MFAPQAELLLFNIQLKDLKFHHFWTFAFMRLNILSEVKMKVKQNLPELERLKSHKLLLFKEVVGNIAKRTEKACIPLKSTGYGAARTCWDLGRTNPNLAYYEDGKQGFFWVTPTGTGPGCFFEDFICICSQDMLLLAH